MEYSLSVWERGMLLAILSSVQGTAGRIRKATSLMDLLDFTQEEVKTFSISASPNGGISWNVDVKDVETKIEIKNPELVVFLKSEAKVFEGWPAYPRGAAVKLLDKIGVTEDGS